MSAAGNKNEFLAKYGSREHVLDMFDRLSHRQSDGVRAYHVFFGMKNPNITVNDLEHLKKNHKDPVVREEAEDEYHRRKNAT